MPRAVVGCLENVIAEVLWRVLMPFPFALPNCHVGIAAGEEAAGSEFVSVPIMNCMMTLLLFLVSVSSSSSSPAGKGARRRIVILASIAPLILLKVSSTLIRIAVRSSVLPFSSSAMMINTVTVTCRFVLPVIRDAPDRFFLKRFGIVTERMLFASTAKNDGRRPDLPDNDLVLFLIPRVERAEVKVLLKSAAVILVRMTELKDVNIQATAGVASESLAQPFGNIRGVVVWIVSSNSDVGVNENSLAVRGFEKCHVTVVHREKRNARGH